MCQIRRLRGEVVGGPDLQQPLGRGLDPDEAAILQHQGVTVVEDRRLGQVEQEGQSADPAHGHAAAMPVAMVEDDAVDDLAEERVSADHFRGADQGRAQNRKYRWAIGSTSAGSQTRSSPSARTS